MEDNLIKNIKHIFIVGCKGIPAQYGGFETFVEKLTEYRKNNKLQYHVACLSEENEYDDKEREFEHNGAHCFAIKERCKGSARAIFYDIDAIMYILRYIRENNIKDAVIYVLACRIGPFIGHLKKKMKKQGVRLYVNPDGHEWKRAKWSPMVRKYWKLSEKLMVKHADLLICDSINIEKYIKEDYQKFDPKTTFIAYGAETSLSSLKDDDSILLEWYRKYGLHAKDYYLVVGRFVPENNFETMIREFMKSETKKDFVLVTGYEGISFYEKLKEETHFEKDKRIKFVGTVYNQELLKKIRENAYGYLHGHEVGGTNPSLLEALASTDLNLLLDVGFNREVGEDGALYWTKDDKNLAGIIDSADEMDKIRIKNMGRAAKERINSAYNWEFIVNKYEEVFINW